MSTHFFFLFCSIVFYITFSDTFSILWQIDILLLCRLLVLIWTFTWSWNSIFFLFLVENLLKFLLPFWNLFFLLFKSFCSRTNKWITASAIYWKFPLPCLFFQGQIVLFLNLLLFGLILKWSFLSLRLI